MVNVREFIDSIAGITDRDEILKAVARVPVEDLRPLLAIVIISWNYAIKAGEAHSAEQAEAIRALEAEIAALEAGGKRA